MKRSRCNIFLHFFSKSFIGCAFFFLIQEAHVCAQASLDSMLTACYPFTGDAQDKSGNNHHGIVHGATLTTDRFGNANSAYHFDGVNSYIEVLRFDSLVPTDEMSISFWCRVNTFASHAQFQIQPDNASDRFNISVHYSHNGIPSTFWDYGSIFTTGRIDTLNMPFVSQWEHYVFVSSAALDVMAEYKDGILIKKVHQHAPIINKMKPLWIGKGSTLACLDGELDDIRIYNRVLKDVDVTALYRTLDNCTDQGPSAAFMCSDTVFCENYCIDFTNMSQHATSWLWLFPGAVPALSTDANPWNICYNAPGTYDVTLIASDNGMSDTLVLSNYITVFPYAQGLGISQSGDTLIANSGFVSYQWFYDGTIIPGATSSFYVAEQGGNYNVLAADSNGCQVEAVIYDVLASIQAAVSPDSYREQLVIFPNPVIDKFTIHSRCLSGSNVTPDSYRDGTAPEISIYNVLGEKIYSPGYKEQSTLNCEPFPAGIYWLQLSSPKGTYRTKFIKQ